tara:strand:- start:285 stop:605 length:321 start_codon:yes stop_codon:yes gene_type:complete
MRIKVTSTCDVRDASSMVVDHLVKAQEQLKSLSSQKFNYWQVGELLEQINLTRDKLANIDQSLDDASNIASGWLEVVLSTSKEGEGDTAADETQEGLEVEKTKVEI